MKAWRPCSTSGPSTSKRCSGSTLREHVNQSVVANYLNVTASLVSKWERGEKRPAGASLKLLSLVEKRGLATVA